ncbi:MAG: hypothetical protein AAGA48_39860 [Myxococcota bacterium]
MQIRLPDGQSVRLSPGALIGRLSSAEVRFADPTVSEAHAMVSLRGRQLKLLSLRRWFEVEGKRCSELVLAAGQRIALAPEVVLVVERVSVAPLVMALAGASPEPYELSAAVHSLVEGPHGLAIQAGFEPNASAHISSSTDGWVLRQRDGTTVDLRADMTFKVAETPLEVVLVAVRGGLTTAPSPSTSRPMRIVAKFDTVHLHPEGRPSTVLTGIAARIISELVAMGGGPVEWGVVAGEIWIQDDDRLLRQNWDRNMRHLRSRLRSVGIRDDLVRPDGKGNTELFLLPGDEVVDET